MRVACAKCVHACVLPSHHRSLLHCKNQVGRAECSSHLVDVDEDDACAQPGEAERQFAADAMAGSRNQDDLAGNRLWRRRRGPVNRLAQRDPQALHVQEHELQEHEQELGERHGVCFA